MTIFVIHSESLIGQINTDAIKLGERITKYSATYKENRDFLLYVPESCSDSLQPKNEIPALFVLDGAELFLTAVALQQQLAEYAYYPILPEMIVVGIVHKNREEELFPIAQNDTLSKMEGKADKFLDYLEKELLPAIDSIRGSKGPRIIFGHSLGGLFGVHTINSKPNLFNAYLLTDPALWWDKQLTLKTFRRNLTSQVRNTSYLYLGISNTLPYKADTVSIQQMNPSQISITSQFQLKHFLENSRKTILRRDARYYPDESHFTIPSRGLRDGLLYYFNNYRCRYFEWMDSDSLSPQELGNAVRVHFEKFAALLGYKLRPPRKNLVAYIDFLEKIAATEKAAVLRKFLKEY
ncbi:alpha/beta hydrolase [Flavihumibacter sp. UBA7668]|uniref:alpha/beta hydrolase n=1 Tax=Flavihumibacter sp. UBA7668 TaxID=1946542 RepID=UPI0025B99BBF|nr:alpha/beta hydrolase-fold protein [Flavihumibacter sp. UBA7668]